MNGLTDLKKHYLEQLQGELNAMEKASAAFEISMRGVSLQTNADAVNAKVQEISDRVNKQFVDAINSEAYEANHSDEERLRCYNEFREESGVLLSKATNVGLTTG